MRADSFAAHFEIPLHIREMLGPPPVAGVKNAKMFETIFAGIARTLKPRDCIEWGYIWDAAYIRFQIGWWRRLLIGLIETPKEIVIAQIAKELWEAEGRKMKEWEPDEEFDNFAYEFQKLKDGGPIDIDAKHAKRDADVDAACKHVGNYLTDRVKLGTFFELKKREALVHHHSTDAMTFPKWIGPYEQAQGIIRELEKRLKKILRELDEYRQNLGGRLRKSHDDIIEGEFEEYQEAPPTQVDVPTTADDESAREKMHNSSHPHDPSLVDESSPVSEIVADECQVSGDNNDCQPAGESSGGAAETAVESSSASVPLDKMHPANALEADPSKP